MHEAEAEVRTKADRALIVLQLRFDVGWQCDDTMQSISECSDRDKFLDLSTNPEHDVALIVGWDRDILNLRKERPQRGIIADHARLMGMKRRNLVTRHH